MRRMYSEKQVQEIVQNALSSGQMQNVKVFENIVDKDGHLRNIEGNLNVETIEGFTATYAKWSLSGTHLMVVLAGNFANESVIHNNSVLATTNNLPQWILDKIYPVWSNVNIERRTMILTSDAWTSQNVDVVFQKQGGVLAITCIGELTLTSNRGFRLAFDLLIDNE